MLTRSRVRPLPPNSKGYAWLAKAQVSASVTISSLDHCCVCRCAFLQLVRRSSIWTKKSTKSWASWIPSIQKVGIPHLICQHPLCVLPRIWQIFLGLLEAVSLPSISHILITLSFRQQLAFGGQFGQLRPPTPGRFLFDLKIDFWWLLAMMCPATSWDRKVAAVVYKFHKTSIVRRTRTPGLHSMSKQLIRAFPDLARQIFLSKLSL